MFPFFLNPVFYCLSADENLLIQNITKILINESCGIAEARHTEIDSVVRNIAEVRTKVADAHL